MANSQGVICAKLVDARSNDSLNFADPVAELNPLNDIRQAVLTVEFAPFL